MKPDRDVVTTTVTVMGIVPGSPPSLAFSKRLHRKDGKEKLHTQWVKILDDQLLRRLESEVQHGDEIEVTLVTDWQADSYTTSLTDFSRVEADADVPHAPASTA